LFPTERYDEISISEDGRDLVIEAKIQGIPFGPTRIPERLGRHALDLLSILMENGGRVVDRRGDDPAEAVGMDLGFGA